MFIFALLTAILGGYIGFKVAEKRTKNEFIQVVSGLVGIFLGFWLPYFVAANV